MAASSRCSAASSTAQSVAAVAKLAIGTQLSQRLSSLESQAWRLREAEDAYTRLAVPAVTEEVKKATERLVQLHEEKTKELEKKTQAFAHTVRVALHGMQIQRTEEQHALTTATAADSKATAMTLRDLQERLSRCEARMLAMTQEQARLSARAGGMSAIPTSNEEEGGATTSIGRGGGGGGGGNGLNGGRAARAAADAASAEASKALACAEVAENAATEAKLALERQIAKQQKAIDEGRDRERRMAARIDALIEALEEQGQESTSKIHALTQRLEEVERGARVTRLTLRNMQIEREPPPPASDL